jgi:ribosomal protein L10
LRNKKLLPTWICGKWELTKVIEIAKKLLQSMLSNAEIANYTGLTVEQVEQLRNGIE